MILNKRHKRSLNAFSVAFLLLFPTFSPAFSAYSDPIDNLYHALATRNISAVKKLMTAVADVNSLCRAYPCHNDSLLTLAANESSSQVEIISIILKAGATVNATDSNGATALIKSSGNAHTDNIRTLLNSGAEVNSADTAGTTALMNAAESGKLENFKLLLSSGAKVNKVADNRCSALELAELGKGRLQQSKSHTSPTIIGRIAKNLRKYFPITKNQRS